MENPPKGDLVLFETQNSLNLSVKGRLLEKVQTPWALTSLLGSVRIANTLSEAYKLRDKLADYESVITPDGIWLGTNWLYSQQVTDEHAGVLAREQEINAITKQLTILNETVITLSETLENERSRLHE